MLDRRLILDTTERAAAVGLAHGDTVAHRRRLDPSRRHARDLTTVIRQLLADDCTALKQLHSIVVCVGPGGYTGLRVGLTTAKVLSYATGVPLVAVSAFDALAEQAPPECERLWVAADALQGEIYFRRYDIGATGRRAVDELRIVPAADWLPWANREVWVTGPGLAIHAGLLPCDARVVPAEAATVQLEGLLGVALRTPQLDRDELFRLEPLYLRGSSAEEKAKRSAAGSQSIG